MVNSPLIRPYLFGGGSFGGGYLRFPWYLGEFWSSEVPWICVFGDAVTLSWYSHQLNHHLLGIFCKKQFFSSHFYLQLPYYLLIHIPFFRQNSHPFPLFKCYPAVFSRCFWTCHCLFVEKPEEWLRSTLLSTWWGFPVDSIKVSLGIP